MANVIVRDAKRRLIGADDLDLSRFKNDGEFAIFLCRRFFPPDNGKPGETFDLPITADVHLEWNKYRQIELYSR